MKTIELGALRHDPDSLIHEIEASHEMVLVEQDRPVAQVRPVVAAPMQPRPCSLYAAQFQVSDGFNDPLPKEVLGYFSAAK